MARPLLFISSSLITLLLLISTSFSFHEWTIKSTATISTSSKRSSCSTGHMNRFAFQDHTHPSFYKYHRQQKRQPPKTITYFTNKNANYGSVTYKPRSDKQQHKIEQHQKYGELLLSMSWFDNVSTFLNTRQNDFVKLNRNNQNKYGPGPIVVLVNVPQTITNDELYDILSDTCTVETSTNCIVHRIDHYIPSSNTDSMDEANNNNANVQTNSNHPELNLSVQDYINQIMTEQRKQIGEEQTKQSAISIDFPFLVATDTTTTTISASSTNHDVGSNKNSILFFSGFGNEEMMNFYNVLSNEIYQEIMFQLQQQNVGEDVGNQVFDFIPPACSKVVPKSINKSMKQVFDEILGDHNDAYLSSKK